MVSPRNRQLGGFKFRRQCAVGPFIADFACIEAKLIVEIDGPSHDGRQAYDSARTAFLERRGFYVLRFAVEDIRENLDGTLEVIYARAVARRDAPRA